MEAFSLTTRTMPQTPRAERRSRYGYKKISEALTHEANSQFALSSVSLYETQSCYLFIFPPRTALVHQLQRYGPILLLLLTLTTWGQYCHIERGALAIIWSRLSRSRCLSKVVKTILQQCSASCPITPEYQLTMTSPCLCTVSENHHR